MPLRLLPKVDRRQIRLAKAGLPLHQLKVEEEKTEANVVVVPSTKTVAVETATMIAVAIEVAVADSVNKAAVEVTNKVDAETTVPVVIENGADRALMIRHQWKIRWRPSRRSRMKNLRASN